MISILNMFSINTTEWTEILLWSSLLFNPRDFILLGFDNRKVFKRELLILPCLTPDQMLSVEGREGENGSWD